MTSNPELTHAVHYSSLSLSSNFE